METKKEKTMFNLKNISKMKNLKVMMMTLMMCLMTVVSFGQISMTKVAEAKPEKVEPYDSLRNFLGNDYKQYKGQELYLIPKAEILRKYGYEVFIKDINKSAYDKSNIFKCCDNYNSKYDELQGKYFTVIDVLEDPISSYSPYAYLKLRMKETNEITFFRYETKCSYIFPFLVVGYYEKQKEIFVGNEVLIRPFPKIEGVDQEKTVDIVTGDEIEFEKGKYVKCLDVTIDDKYYEPALLLENDKGQKFLFELYTRYLHISRILTKQEAEDYRKRFGEENWQTILNEKVKVGFTEEMTKVSWGEPDKINRASYGDQWVYGDQYLYFENGKLKAFN